ncbi:MAG: GntR family transcriptional regulator, partial [Anaerolineales bacterium]|nr:GntR family transcriptional regulator [Anaerolineales bacterium]
MAVEVQLSGRRINKEIPVPYYYQIAQILREVIEDQQLDPGQGEASLPSEAELCDVYGVTRGTVRHALEVIEREGLIYREKGRGTFLTRRRVELDLNKLCSTTEDMRARGWEPSTIVLGLEKGSPRPHVRYKLGVGDEDGCVWMLHRLRLANDEPVSLQWSYIPCALAPDLDTHDLTGSLYYVLKNEYGIELKT